jgi:uncharacterized protein
MIGEVPQELLTALLDTLPCEFTLTDASDQIVAWNQEGRRLFGRSPDILGADVRECHRQRGLAEAEYLLAELKSGRLDRVRVWGERKVGPNKEKRRVLVEYCALRGPAGEYLGCAEFGLDLSDLQSLTGDKRTID